MFKGLLEKLKLKKKPKEETKKAEKETKKPEKAKKAPEQETTPAPAETAPGGKKKSGHKQSIDKLTFQKKVARRRRRNEIAFETKRSQWRMK